MVTWRTSSWFNIGQIVRTWCIYWINEKEEASPLQNLFKYFNQLFKDISWPYTSANEINKMIDSLKDKNSSGYDEISTKIIKISKPFIISPLINICNKMLAQGIYPERLKFSLIKPIYKSGDKSSPSNYRLISLLPVFSKIFKKVIYKRLFDNLNSNVTLNKHQCGFRSGVNRKYFLYFTQWNTDSIEQQTDGGRNILWPP